MCLLDWLRPRASRVTGVTLGVRSGSAAALEDASDALGALRAGSLTQLALSTDRCISDDSPAAAATRGLLGQLERLTALRALSVDLHHTGYDQADELELPSLQVRLRVAAWLAGCPCHPICLPAPPITAAQHLGSVPLTRL